MIPAGDIATPRSASVTVFNPAPGGGTSSSFAFSVEAVTEAVTLFVPIVLSAAGLNNSFFTSELTLTNRSNQDASLSLTYTAAFGGGSGTATDNLPAGRQRIVPDAITYLMSLGVPIPASGNRGGTLQIEFTGPSSISERGATRPENG
jgi:hypothetical protein